VRETDFADLDFDDESFDLVWARHALEHSVVPAFLLSEFHRLTKPGGVLYVEVPAPDTACVHETNPNHHSVLASGCGWR
jgi:ubiquinone/menaquinone biosynthesis C-methylase UbiE